MANEQVREELFIVIDYLLNHASKKNPLNQQNLITYAEKNYNVAIRRDRIPDICQHLEQLTSNYPDKFHFDVLSVTKNKEKRYYAIKTLFTEREINQIILSLDKNQYIDREFTRALTQKVLDVSLVPSERPVTEGVNRAPSFYFIKQPDRLIRTVEILKKAQQHQSLVPFVLLYDHKTGLIDYPEIKAKEPLNGYVYSLMQFNYVSYASMYIPRLSVILTIQIRYIRVTGTPIAMEGDAPDIPQLFQSKYPNMTIDQYFADNILPFTEGEAIDITFRFKKTEQNFLNIKESFETTFAKPLPYTYEPVMKDGVNINYVIVNYKVNSLAFLKWATIYDVAEIIEIVSPTNVIDQLKNLYMKLYLKFENQ